MRVSSSIRMTLASLAIAAGIHGCHHASGNHQDPIEQGGNCGDPGGSHGGSGGNPSNSGDGGTGGDADEECIDVRLGRTIGGYDESRSAFSYIAEIVPNILGPAEDILGLDLLTDETGSFTLDSEKNSDPSTCDQCLIAVADVGNDSWAHAFWQKSGTIHIYSTTDEMLQNAIDARIENVTLVEVEITEEGFIPVQDGKCLTIRDEKLVIEIIPGWTCPWPWYNDGDYCDCACGMWDPDCDTATNPMTGCAKGQTCEKTEAGLSYCAGIPTAWTCAPDRYADGSVCDCDCGYPDPDCANDLLPQTGCEDGTRCTASSPTCIPDGWTCPDSYFLDGYCDCYCGAYDKDCDDDKAFVFGCVPGFACLDVDGIGTCEDDMTWICRADRYADGAFCDCSCGSYDPDCNIVGATLRGCTPEATACIEVAGKAVCEGGGRWACLSDYYNDGSVCDCMCGAWDPDCDIPGAKVWGCSAGKVCRKDDENVSYCAVP